MIQAIAGIMALAVMVAPASGASAAQPPRGYYLALGDSVAAGEGARVPDRFGYAGLFQHFYRADHQGTERFARLAVLGETSSSFLGDQVTRAEEVINDPGTNVQVVTLTIGANDFLPLLSTGPCVSDPAGTECEEQVGVALGAFAANYQGILTRLNTALAQEDPGEGRVLVTTYYNPFDGTGALMETPVDTVLLGLDGTVDCAASVADQRNMGLNDIIACVGAQHGVEIVDIYPLFNDTALALTHITENDTHPNNDGHRSIADAVISAYQGG